MIATSREPRVRVLQVALSLDAGGTERLVIDLTRNIRSTVDAAVCCLDGAGTWSTSLTNEGVEVVALHRRPGFRPSIARQIAAVATQYRANVIHCHQYSPFVYGQLAALLSRRIGLVFTEHGRLSDAEPSAKRRLANSVLGRLPGRFYAVSDDLKQHLVAEGFPSHRVGVIYNGIDPGVVPSPEARARARRRLSLTDDAFVVGTAGRLDPVKDITTLLEGFAAVRAIRHTAHLVIVGGGSERLNLERHAAMLGLTGGVRFTGHRDDVRDLLPAFDVFVNSSITEGLSVTILEAMAAALPIVATRVGGTPEIVKDADTGILIDARQPAAVARAISDLAERPASRTALGAAARARLERCYDLNRMVAQYVNIYHSLARTA